MSNVAIDLTKTVKEIITTMKTAIDNLNTNVDSLKSEILLAAHPVGSYYISDNATDPGTLFGGTWKMLDPGLTLISQGKGTDKFGSFEFVAGQIYGERLHQLTVDELANHNHVYRIYVGSLGTTQTDAQYGKFLAALSYSDVMWDCGDKLSPEYHINFTGGDKPHNNVQPCKAVYAWYRTA